MKKKTVSLLLALALSAALAAPVSAVYETPTFTDVSKSFWGYVSIEKAAENKWISGNPDGTFAPNANVTYAQFCVMLVRAFYNEDYESYDGPKGAWYVPFTTIASQKGLLDGTNVVGHETDEDYVGQFMNRYEMALMAANTLKKINAKLPSASEQADQMDKTPDYWDIPKQYRNAVLLAKACGVLSGMDSAGTFGGTGNLNRAQACVVLIKLDEMKDTGDGSGDTPTEISRSPFAFQDGENVQQMMNRLNAEAPKYFEGYLTNGKPITEENIKEMLSEAEKGMPSRTKWDTSDFYQYGTRAFGNYRYAYACSAFAGALSDYIFGKDAPVTKHQNFDNIKVGDIIDWNNSSTGYGHAVLVTTIHPTTDDSYGVTNGNLGGMVIWDNYTYIDSIDETTIAESYIYSRY